MRVIAVVLFAIELLAACDNMSTQLRPIPIEPQAGISTSEIASGAPNLPSQDALATGDDLPFPLTREGLARGAERYAIACTPCHGALGDGGGVVALRGYAWVPSFHTPELRRETLSHFYNVMSFGYGAMPPHAAQLEPDDRWRVAAYVRALQLSQHAAIADVPKAERERLTP
jgi:mono/diheme cytochrome c family protein